LNAGASFDGDVDPGFDEFRDGFRNERDTSFAACALFRNGDFHSAFFPLWFMVVLLIGLGRHRTSQNPERSAAHATSSATPPTPWVMRLFSAAVPRSR